MKSIVFLVMTFGLAGSALAGDVQYDIRVDGITCPFCVATSERELKKIEGVHEVGSDLASGIIFVCAGDQVVFTDAQLRKLFLDKGFTYRSYKKKPGCSLGERMHKKDSVDDGHDKRVHDAGTKN